MAETEVSRSRDEEKEREDFFSDGRLVQIHQRRQTEDVADEGREDAFVPVLLLEYICIQTEHFCKKRHRLAGLFRDDKVALECRQCVEDEHFRELRDEATRGIPLSVEAVRRMWCECGICEDAYTTQCELLVLCVE